MAKRLTSIEKPSSIEYLGDGTYYYNYDIVAFEVEKKEEIQVKYSYVQVHLRGQANYVDCVKAIIREFVSETEEFDLVNSYNKYSLGISNDVEDRENYIEYLSLLEEIKNKIQLDFNK